MTDHDTLVTLLEHYQDVQPGLVDTGEHLNLSDESSGDDWALLAAGCWKHPTYRELERLRVVMRDTKPRVYWHLAETYFRCVRRRVMRCTHGTEAGSRCKFAISVAVYQRAPKKPVHEHRGRRHSLTAAVERVVRDSVDEECVDAAIDWLIENWRENVPLRLPEDLLGVKAA